MQTIFTDTTDFRREFDEQTTGLLRKQFLWFTAVLAAYNYIFLLLRGIPLAVQIASGDTANFREIGATGSIFAILIEDGLTASMYVGLFLLVMRSNVPRKRLVLLVYWAIFADGCLSLASHATSTFMLPPGLISVGTAIGAVLLPHFLGSLIMPLTPIQSLRPIVPLLLINLVLVITFEWPPTWMTLIPIVLSLLVLLPGGLIAWLKHSYRVEQFKVNFLKQRYGQIRRDLVDARRIHESLFPVPILSGPIRFDYQYEPMRQIGGDFLFAQLTPYQPGSTPKLNFVLIDVTGHGIAAALTVNRLAGELERLFAEHPDASPGEVLEGLNRYVHLTLARHSIYPTALCACVDPDRRVVRFASGGHPPAFICTVDGRVERLDSTTFVLGACNSDDFDPCEQSVPFGEGDALVAYTDGAIEAIDEDGKQFGLDRFEKMLASFDPGPDSARAASILQIVERFRLGPPRDDTLVVEVTRPITPSKKRDRSPEPANQAGT